MTDIDRLEQIRAREQAATKGPWGTYNDGTGRIDIAADMQDTGHGYRCRREVAQTVDMPIDNDQSHEHWTEDDDQQQIEADADFIAHAREDVPWLLDQNAVLAAKVAERDAAIERLERDREQAARQHGEEVDRLTRLLERAQVEARTAKGGAA